MTSAAASSPSESHGAPSTLDDISRRLDRLRRIVYLSGRPTVEEVDAVLRDVATLSRTDGSIPSWKIREIDEDVAKLAAYGTQRAPSVLPHGMKVPTQRRPGKRRPGSASTPRVAAGPTQPDDLISRANALLDAVDAGAAVTPERIRAMQEELRVAINIASSRRDSTAAALKSLHGRLARAKGRVEARHAGARPTAPPSAASTPDKASDSKKSRTLRSFIPKLRRPVRSERPRRVDAQGAQELRKQAHRLARALECGQEVSQSQITDVLYRFAARGNERSSPADACADRGAIRRLETADRKSRQRNKRRYR